MFRAEEVNTGTNESEFGCDPQDSVGRSSLIFANLRELTEINAKKFFKKNAHTF